MWFNIWTFSKYFPLMSQNCKIACEAFSIQTIKQGARSENLSQTACPTTSLPKDQWLHREWFLASVTGNNHVSTSKVSK